MSTATVGTIQAYGASGAAYQFEVHAWGTTFKPLGAVYLVLKAAPGSSIILYVGQTGNLSERFDNHHKKSCFDRLGRTHIAVLLEGSEASRLRIEQDLIRKYRPSCNEAI